MNSGTSHGPPAVEDLFLHFQFSRQKTIQSFRYASCDFILEYIARRNTLKADAYTFGMLLLEIVTWHRASEGSYMLAKWIRPKLRGGNIVSIADTKLKGQFSAAMSEKAVQVALMFRNRSD